VTDGVVKLVVIEVAGRPHRDPVAEERADLAMQ
jgi:hypothetical protein